ncbi:endonuclease 1 [Selaginella moellendorffii]|uniref:endonuclease 1 n=1 Tax=Selaginella moellendorffii TaxID=88036 RepID=UPI000D1C7840|nr:endonuclease 1 [Selaginella moellendorffii]|eukprot:XP_024517683.1 endonuclease 1 [Selaginella moellendorffii]
MVTLRSVVLLLAAFSAEVAGWGDIGHIVTCTIAQSLFKAPTQSAVTNLLSVTSLNFSHACLWPDQVKRSYAYSWSAPLHFADTPDNVCGFDDERDCHYFGAKNVCITAAIYNYTSQLEHQHNVTYNLTEALMFLAHFLGDIHQPMHLGFLGDLGGNTILLTWYNRSSNLHRVWDSDIINKALERFYAGSIASMEHDIKKNITAEEAAKWGHCPGEEFTCPVRYAKESIKFACASGYKDAPQNSTLADAYFETRWPIVKLLLARAGVRLANTLNKVLDKRVNIVHE